VFFQSLFRADRYVYTAKLRPGRAEPAVPAPTGRSRRPSSVSKEAEERHG
jgi:hypothetical protein